MAVVHLGDLDVPVLAQPRRRLVHQMRQQRDPQRGVAGLEHRDAVAGGVDQPVMALFEPVGADDDRDVGGNRGIEIGLERCWRREVDQDVALFRQCERIAALVDSARNAGACVGDCRRQRLSHPACIADNSDARHRCMPLLWLVSAPGNALMQGLWQRFPASSSSPAPA